ncbi:MAG: hypothetical protein AM1032_000062 [Mycoplasmataceae bacterium]|nr:MAG: hypothetical protein AM1032_000062 [Mycoplasmataceae bacterium]
MIDGNFQEDDDYLLGKTYHFFKIKEVSSIKSPISGRILKIFFDKNTVLISNICGLQIILRIKLKDDLLLSENENFNVLFRFKEGDKIKKGSEIFFINNENSFECATIFIPWQPLIIKKIEGLNIFYRNPWSTLKTKLYGDYF